MAYTEIVVQDLHWEKSTLRHRLWNISEEPWEKRDWSPGSVIGIPKFWCHRCNKGQRFPGWHIKENMGTIIMNYQDSQAEPWSNMGVQYFLWEASTMREWDTERWDPDHGFQLLSTSPSPLAERCWNEISTSSDLETGLPHLKDSWHRPTATNR